MVYRLAPLVLVLFLFSACMQKSACVSSKDPAFGYHSTEIAPKPATVCKECSSKHKARLNRTVGHTTPTVSLVTALRSNRLAIFAPGHTARKSSGHNQCHKAIQQHPRNCNSIRDKCSGYGDGMFNYVELYYCSYPSWHFTSLALLLVWLFLLFIWLGVSASEYFSPNISTLAKLLRIPESLAGVTLLALGNGAPDMFSTFSAVRAGSGALAIGQLVGSASFIVGVVLSATTFVSPVYRVSSIPYLRELCFFTATIGAVAVVVLSEKLTRSMAAYMVGLYVMYVVAVVLTTYYEERSQYTQAQVFPEDAARPLLQPSPENTSITNSSTESRLRYTGIAGHSASMLLEPLWARSTASLASRARRQQWHRRRATTSATYTHLACSDMWALDTLKGSASVKALGGFLSQHRKSLLAAAECGEILDQVHCAATFVDRARLLGNVADESMPLQSEPIDHSPLYAAMPISTTTRNSMCETTSIQENTMELARTPALPPPSLWNDYSVGRVGSRADKHDACTLGSTNSAQETSPENSARWSENATTPSRYLHIVSLGEPTHEQTDTLPETAGAKSTPASPYSTHPSSRVCPEESTQPSHGSHPLLDYRTENPQIPRANDSGNMSASIVMPTTPQSFHAVLASTDGGGPPCIWPSPSPSSSFDVAGQQCGRGTAFARACIPTLHYWHPEASVKLKVFIAFSAIPVFLMTLTVPVLVLSSDNDDNDDNDNNDSTPGSIRSIPQENTNRQLTRYSRIETNLENQGTCVNGEPLLGDSHNISNIASSSSSFPRIPHVRSPYTSVPVYTTSDSESSAGENQDPTTKQPYPSSPRTVSLSSANVQWAEEVASYLRSVVSVVFLCHALYYSGYLAPNIDRQTRNTLSIGLAAISMAGNYLIRRFSFSTYWLQIALPCFAGFACGLVWVSIIADEIVSITQALGLMLGMTEEILGLTVVGFGNSLGDLVTNLTLTRMGYPMMAVSACFGGPMLYILLGVGVAACGIMTGSGPIGNTYWIPITSPAVLVSTACLVINSMVFLVAVPLQGFRITRAVGIVALSVYMMGMVLNIYLELEQMR